MARGMKIKPVNKMNYDVKFKIKTGLTFREALILRIAGNSVKPFFDSIINKLENSMEILDATEKTDTTRRH